MNEATFSEVRAEPLSEVVLRVVREAIIEGHLAPGAQINQAELAKQLAVSRAPLREALKHLENDGLVINVPYRGTVVTPITRKGIEELQSFRKLMENFAAELMLQRCTDEDFDEFESLVDEMERSAKTGNVTEMNAADVAFHSRIIQLSDHQMLRMVWDSYVQQIRRALTLRNQANHDLTFLVQLHRDLVSAFRAHDLERVRKCYEAHGTDVPARLAHLFVEDDHEITK